jgi:putative phosphoribosyl transferase
MWFEPKIHDRREAGAILAEHLKEYAQIKDLIVLALPRGGVPVAFEVAKALRAPLDVFVVRKLGVPGQEEFAFGAIASGGVKIVNPRLVKALHLSSNTIERIVERELAELERRERLYRGSRPPLNVAGKTVIIVDDGLATGATMRAAIAALRKQDPKRIIVGVPVASQQTCNELHHEAELLVVCAITPEPFYGVGMWYEDFSQTSDEEVRRLLELADRSASASA